MPLWYIYVVFHNDSHVILLSLICYLIFFDTNWNLIVKEFEIQLTQANWRGLSGNQEIMLNIIQYSATDKNMLGPVAGAASHNESLTLKWMGDSPTSLQCRVGRCNYGLCTYESFMGNINFNRKQERKTMKNVMSVEMSRPGHVTLCKILRNMCLKL